MVLDDDNTKEDEIVNPDIAEELDETETDEDEDEVLLGGGLVDEENNWM